MFDYRSNMVTDPSGSIPFFFEPNFDALVKPLAAALRIKGKEAPHGNAGYQRNPVVYGDFLLRKVGNNFASDGKGKYDD